MNTQPLRIGRRVTLQDAPEAQKGSVIDFDPDEASGLEKPFPYLVEWDDHTTSWHRWFELTLVAGHA